MKPPGSPMNFDIPATVAGSIRMVSSRKICASLFKSEVGGMAGSFWNLSSPTPFKTIGHHVAIERLSSISAA